MKCSLGISDFLEEISSLSHSIVFLYIFALIAEESFIISPCYSLELCIQMLISFLFTFAFGFSSFHSYLQGLLRQPVCFFTFLFLGNGLDPCLLYNVCSVFCCFWMNYSVVVVIQSLSHVQLFATPWTTTCRHPLVKTDSRD